MELEKAGESGRFGNVVEIRLKAAKGRHYVKLLKEIATLFV